jgi:hypothetical protein
MSPPLQRVRHSTSPEGTGNVAGFVSHTEAQRDLWEMVLPSSHLRTAALQGPGVLKGLTVSATLNGPGLVVMPGLALSGDGRVVAVTASDGQLNDFRVRLQAASAGGSATDGLATVDATTGVTVPTTDQAGDHFLILEWNETLLTIDTQSAYRSTPWLRLEASSDDPAGRWVVLAQVTLGSGDKLGQVTALTAGPRRSLPLLDDGLILRRPLTAAAPPAVDDRPAARLAVRADGGLSVRLGTVDGGPGALRPVLEVDGPTGHVGIGTDTPTHPLHVPDNLGIRQGRLYLTGGAGNGWSSLAFNAFHRADNADWIFPDPSRPAVTLEMDHQDDSGNHARFEVWATTIAATTSFKPRLQINGESGDTFLVPSGGRVGVGFQGPRTPLHVLGTIASGLDFNSPGTVTLFPPDGFAWFHLDNGPAGGRPLGRLRFSHGPAPGAFEIMCLTQAMNVGIGTANPQARLHVVGEARIDGHLTVTGGKAGFVMDRFVNASGRALEPGDVVVIAREQRQAADVGDGYVPLLEVELAEAANDARVCGIVCEPYAPAAGSPTLDSDELADAAPKAGGPWHTRRVEDGAHGWMVTLGAFACCKVDADLAPIQAGDLLTVSPTRGHAQKVLDARASAGAIVGKALGSLAAGQGRIPVMVTLR